MERWLGGWLCVVVGYFAWEIQTWGKTWKMNEDYILIRHKRRDRTQYFLLKIIVFDFYFGDFQRLKCFDPYNSKRRERFGFAP